MTQGNYRPFQKVHNVSLYSIAFSKYSIFMDSENHTSQFPPYFIYDSSFLRTDGLTTQDGQRLVSSDDKLIVFAVASVERHELKLYQILHPSLISSLKVFGFLRTDGLTRQDGQGLVSSDDELIVFTKNSNPLPILVYQQT